MTDVQSLSQFSFTAADFKRLEAETRRISRSVSLDQDMKNEIWGVTKNIVEAQRGSVNYAYECSVEKQRLVSSSPQMFGDQSSTNPF